MSRRPKDERDYPFPIPAASRAAELAYKTLQNPSRVAPPSQQQQQQHHRTHRHSSSGSGATNAFPIGGSSGPSGSSPTAIQATSDDNKDEGQRSSNDSSGTGTGKSNSSTGKSSAASRTTSTSFASVSTASSTSLLSMGGAAAVAVPGLSTFEISPTQSKSASVSNICPTGELPASQFDELLQRTAARKGMPQPGLDYFNARRALWLQPPPVPPTPVSPSPSRVKLEALLNQPGAVESEEVWKAGLKNVWKGLVGGNQLRKRLPLSIALKILQAGWLRDGTWPAGAVAPAWDGPSSNVGGGASSTLSAADPSSSTIQSFQSESSISPQAHLHYQQEAERRHQEQLRHYQQQLAAQERNAPSLPPISRDYSSYGFPGYNNQQGAYPYNHQQYRLAPAYSPSSGDVTKEEEAQDAQRRYYAQGGYGYGGVGGAAQAYPSSRPPTQPPTSSASPEPRDGTAVWVDGRGGPPRSGVAGGGGSGNGNNSGGRAAHPGPPRRPTGLGGQAAMHNQAGRDDGRVGDEPEEEDDDDDDSEEEEEVVGGRDGILGLRRSGRADDGRHEGG